MCVLLSRRRWQLGRQGRGPHAWAPPAGAHGRAVRASGSGRSARRPCRLPAAGAGPAGRQPKVRIAGEHHAVWRCSAGKQAACDVCVAPRAPAQRADLVPAGRLGRGANAALPVSAVQQARRAQQPGRGVRHCRPRPLPSPPPPPRTAARARQRHPATHRQDDVLLRQPGTQAAAWRQLYGPRLCAVG